MDRYRLRRVTSLKSPLGVSNPKSEVEVMRTHVQLHLLSLIGRYRYRCQCRCRYRC